MGTRADFYIGRGEQAEWLGSIAWDGYSIPDNIRYCTDEQIYRDFVKAFLNERDDATHPENGWPWPWEDSRTTDYSYTFDEGKVYGSCFGHFWWEATQDEPEYDAERSECIFPNMKERQNVRWDKGSGIILMGVKS